MAAQLIVCYSYENACHEAGFLKLDCTKVKAAFGWKPMWHLEVALERVVEWIRVYMEGEDIEGCLESQITEYIL